MSIDIAKSREICDAATPGPWDQLGQSETNRPYILCVTRQHLAKFSTVTHGDGNCGPHWPAMGRSQETANAAFIAHARTALPAALDEIERLRAELARLTPASSPPPAADPPAPGHTPGSC